MSFVIIDRELKDKFLLIFKNWMYNEITTHEANKQSVELFGSRLTNPDFDINKCHMKFGELYIYNQLVFTPMKLPHCLDN